MVQLQNFLPSLGLPEFGVQFALYWVSDEDTEMNYPIIQASVSTMMKWSDYKLAATTGETFIDYLNRVGSVQATAESEEAVTVDFLMYTLNRADLSQRKPENRWLCPQ